MTTAEVPGTPSYMSEERRWERYNPSELEPHYSAVATDWPPNKKLVRGYRVEDLITNCTFGETIFLLLFKRLPAGRERRMFEAVLATHCSGTYASTTAVAARSILTSHPDSHVAVAGGLLAFGFAHAGATDDAAVMIQAAVAMKRAQGLGTAEAAARVVDGALERHERIPGIGHPFFSGSDPRVDAIIGLSRELGVAGEHTELYIAIADELRSRRQQQVQAHLVLNPEGANVATMCDLLGDEYEAKSSNLWHLIGRIPSICATVLEHHERGTRLRIPWTYDGPPERDLPDDFTSIVTGTENT
jgi:citryl-CoA lyase